MNTMSCSDSPTNMDCCPGHSRNLVVEHGDVSHKLGAPFRIFSKFVRVFDLYFVATKSSPDDRLLHGACIFYQYIDNDDDGQPDNALVYEKLVEMRATMVMFESESKMEENDRFFEEVDDCHVEVQDLQADETNSIDEFDASIEECFHLVTAGYAQAYPRIFGTKKGSYLANCCDTARGGYFRKVPRCYPANAWFTYYDKGCDYSEQVTEYVYWAMTSILGAQEHRRDIQDEWRLYSRELVEMHDPKVYALLTDERYKLPKKLPKTNIAKY